MDTADLRDYRRGHREAAVRAMRAGMDVVYVYAAHDLSLAMHFLQRRPQGYIDDRMIDVDCNSATDAGLYTFRFADGSSVKARYSFSYKRINGQWLITSHHSSGMPEKPAAPPAAHAEVHAAPKASDPGSPTKGWVRFP
jgi:hypothetical protein